MVELGAHYSLAREIDGITGVLVEETPSMSTVAIWAMLVLAMPAEIQTPVDACTVASADEIRTSLGRKELGSPKQGRASGGYSECTFPGLGAGDVRILLSPPGKDAAADFDLKEEILKEEQKKFEKLPGIGDGAYYYDDRLEFRVGNRMAAVWVNRTTRTESDATVKAALSALARRITSSLRGQR